MSKSYKVNGDLIKSSGQKLKTVGYLIIGNVGVFILYLLFILNASYAHEIQTAGVLTAIISVIFGFLIIMNIIESGEGFIKSVEVMTEKKEQTGPLSDKVYINERYDNLDEFHRLISHDIDKITKENVKEYIVKLKPIMVDSREITLETEKSVKVKYFFSLPNSEGLSRLKDIKFYYGVWV